jgi:transposase
MATDESARPRAAGRPQEPGAAAPGRGGRMSRQRKTAAVLRLLRGDDLETVSRALGVTAATLSGWRDAFLAAGEAALAIRPDGGEALEGARLKAKLGEAGRSYNTAKTGFEWTSRFERGALRRLYGDGRRRNGVKRRWVPQVGAASDGGVDGPALGPTVPAGARILRDDPARPAVPDRGLCPPGPGSAQGRPEGREDQPARGDRPGSQTRR